MRSCGAAPCSLTSYCSDNKCSILGPYLTVVLLQRLLRCCILQRCFMLALHTAISSSGRAQADDSLLDGRAAALLASTWRICSCQVGN